MANANEDAETTEEVVVEEKKKKKTSKKVVDIVDLSTDIREQMYEGLGIKAVINKTIKPNRCPRPLLLDYAVDVTNATSIIHSNVDSLLDLMQLADGIIVDNEQLAHLINQFTNSIVPVVQAQYGQLFHVKDKVNDTPVIGLLNYGTYAISNAEARDLLQGLSVPFLCYGKPLEGVECDVVDTFTEFARRIDILVCPNGELTHHAITPILAAMSVGTAVIASSSGSYYQFSNCYGVMPMTNRNKVTWSNTLNILLGDSVKLRKAKEQTVAYARRVSMDGSKIANAFYKRLERKQ